MFDVIRELASPRGGYFFRADALSAGLDDRFLRSAQRANLLLRVRHGTYVPTAVAQELSTSEKILLLGKSVLARVGSGAVLSHDTALAIHTGATWRLDLKNIHITRRDGRQPRRDAGVVNHAGATTEADIDRIDGVPVMRAGRAAVEVASRHTTEVGMAHLSLALRTGRIGRDELARDMSALRHWPGMSKVRLAAGYADPRCENVAEIRSLYVFRRYGVPLPEPQVEIHDDDGSLIGRVDFDWHTFRHVGEVDGAAKYADYAKPGDPTSVLVGEKWREDDVRDTMRGVSRWGWVDLGNGRALAALIMTALERSRRIYVRRA